MNLLISLLYAPTLLFALRYFDLKIISIFLFFISFLWFSFNLKKGFREYIVALVYLIFSIVAYFLDSTLLLKILPAFMSFLISLYILYSYLNRHSFIFDFLAKIGKDVDLKEREYIQKSTLFWFASSLVNFFIHCYILYINDIILWSFYASIGWYFVFVTAGVIQFIHKRFR